MNNNNLYGVWRKVTSSILLIVFGFQFTLPVYAATQLLTDEQIKADFTSAPQFVLRPDTSYQYRLAEHVTASKPASFVSMMQFFEVLKQQHPSALDSVRLMIPISVGDITTIIPIYPISQQIGDEFIQARYIRNQVTNQLNRLLIDGTDLTTNTEGKQSSVLYNNALEYAKTSGKKFGERLTESDYPVADVIWPEYRKINNKRVLVPILYLTQATIDARKVSGHTVEKVSGLSKYNSVTLNAGTLKTYRDHTILVAENFVNRSVIESKGDLSIIADIFENLSGQISSTGSVQIAANDIKHKTVVYQYQTAHGVSSRAGKIASISADGDIVLNSSGDIVVSGAIVQSGSNIIFNSSGNVYITSAELLNTSTGIVSGYDSSSSNLHHLVSKVSAEDSISIFSAGGILIDAAELTTDKGYIELYAKLGITVKSNFNQTHGVYERKDERTERFKSFVVRSLLDAGKDVILHTTVGDITLQASDIIARGGAAKATALNGRLNLLIAKEQDNYQYDKTEKNWFRTKTISYGHKIETAQYVNIIGGLQANAAYGVDVEYVGDPTLSLDDQVTQLSQFEGLEWVSQVKEQVSDAEWSEIELQYEKWHEVNRTLSPGAMALISIITVVAMGPAGLQWIGANGAIVVAENAVLTAALQAGAVSLVNNAVIGFSSGQNIGEVTEALVSSDNLRSLATSMVTAGALSYVNSEFFSTPKSVDGNTSWLYSDDGKLSLMGQAANGVMDAAIKASVGSIINGGNWSDFGGAFTQALGFYAVDTIGEQVANKIGSLAAKGEIDEALRYVSHAALGCALGVAQGAISDNGSEGKSCAAGAGGAVIGEATAQVYTHQMLTDKQIEVLELFKTMGIEYGTDFNNLDDVSINRIGERLTTLQYKPSPEDLAFIQNIQAAGVDVAKLSGAMAAFAAGLDVNIAASTATNAAEHNWAQFVVLAFKGAMWAMTAYSAYEAASKLADSYGEWQKLESQPEAQKEFLITAIQDLAIDTAVDVTVGKLSKLGVDKLLDKLYHVALIHPNGASILAKIDEFTQKASYNANGSFSDTDIENRYQAYLDKGKFSTGQPRERHEYLQVITERGILNMERGNLFNRYAEFKEWHKYTEVTVDFPNCRNCRLDALNTGQNGAYGLIERKSTYLDAWDEQDFSKLLDGIKAKYPATGGWMRAAKYQNKGLYQAPLIIDSYTLELPDVNANLPNIQRFVDIAASKGFIVSFKPEPATNWTKP
jgi:filamentous hemagglutinin